MVVGLATGAVGALEGALVVGDEVGSDFKVNDDMERKHGR